MESMSPYESALERIKEVLLTNESWLYLGFLDLSVLPPEIGQLVNLESLILYNNKLTALPAEIGQLANLQSLHLSNNHLESLPVEISNLTKLSELVLEGNPLPIPPEIIEKTGDPQTILNYYFSIFEKPRRSLNEIKLMIVGEGAVGKTSLIQRILLNKFDWNQNKTEGISISQWLVEKRVKQKKDFQIRLNIWDFGGQEIMHATHQFFLSKRSLYLLVLDSRLTQEGNRVEYWLKIIQSFGGESPVLIVGNKIDQHPLDIDRTGLQKKYPNIVGILETSAATGTGIEDLKAAIAEQVNNLPHVRDLLPETWFTVKIKLENLGRKSNFITHDKYIELCVENEVNDETSQRTLIGFLHDLGVVLHFQDDPRLEALGIFNPQWVTNGVYKILNSHALFQNKGALTVSMLDEILNLPEYPRGKRLFIVDLMRKFELCYDIDSDTFLIPDLLPKDEPYTGEWNDALAFEYHYKILLTSIFSRFIVRMNTYIYKTVWRSGVVLQNEGNKALVRADFEEKKIYIRVTGNEPTRRDFLSAIRAEFESIHKTITKVESRGKVAIPKHIDVVVDYEYLLKLENKGVANFIPEGIDESVSVSELLNGIRPKSSQPTSGNMTNIFVNQDISGNLTVGDQNVSQITLPRISSRELTVEHNKTTASLNKKKKLSYIIGRLLLDLFTQHEPAETTSNIIGWGIIFLLVAGGAVAVLSALGVIDTAFLCEWFTTRWQLYFPQK